MNDAVYPRISLAGDELAALLWPEPHRLVFGESGSGDAVSPKDRQIEMTPFESAFLCGLLRHKKPQKILEVGVAAGGTTAVLLTALAEMQSGACLYSVDISERLYSNPALAVAHVVHEKTPHLTANWRLGTGRVVSAFMEHIGGEVDFCILDTAHKLPGEVLDFIAVFPYLAEGATVVLHDTHLHVVDFNAATGYATKVLLDAVVADRIIPCDPAMCEALANISAFTVTADTKKYMTNVFTALTMPWEYIPDNMALNDFYAGITQHYPQEYAEYFMKAVKMNYARFVHFNQAQR